MIIGLLVVLIGGYLAHCGAQAAFGLQYFNNPLVPLVMGIVLYLWMSTGYAMRGNWGLCWMWFGYAFANLGIIWVTLKELK